MIHQVDPLYWRNKHYYTSPMSENRYLHTYYNTHKAIHYGRVLMLLTFKKRLSTSSPQRELEIKALGKNGGWRRELLSKAWKTNWGHFGLAEAAKNLVCVCQWEEVSPQVNFFCTPSVIIFRWCARYRLFGRQKDFSIRHVVFFLNAKKRHMTALVPKAAISQ